MIGMTQEQALVELKNMGYDAFIREDDEILMLRVKKGKYRLKKLQKMMREIGYKKSWGVIEVKDD